MSSSNSPQLQRREYGKTGVQLSIIGFGGIVAMNTEHTELARAVAESVERGVNYFDVAPSYGDAEQRLGPALEPYRKGVFLACKTHERTAEGARATLEKSFENLRTDYFDLFQLHAITDVEKDVDAVFARGGAMEVILEARKQGRIRFLGFSAHTPEAAFAAMDRYDFDSILFPVNFASWFSGFGPQIMERAIQKGMARLCLKALARQKWPENHPHRERFGKCWYEPVSDRREAELALKWTLSQPVTAAVCPGEVEMLRLALDAGMSWEPITPAEEQELRDKALHLTPTFPL